MRVLHLSVNVAGDDPSVTEVRGPITALLTVSISTGPRSATDATRVSYRYIRSATVYSQSWNPLPAPLKLWAVKKSSTFATVESNPVPSAGAVFGPIAYPVPPALSARLAAIAII